METLHRYPLEMYRWKFKSYYVVWKLAGLCFAKDLVAWFKSYYVVWKHLQKIIAEITANPV